MFAQKAAFYSFLFKIFWVFLDSKFDIGSNKKLVKCCASGGIESNNFVYRHASISFLSGIRGACLIRLKGSQGHIWNCIFRTRHQKFANFIQAVLAFK